MLTSSQHLRIVNIKDYEHHLLIGDLCVVKVLPVKYLQKRLTSNRLDYENQSVIAFIDIS
jgi:hypothetical protein